MKCAKCDKTIHPEDRYIKQSLLTPDKPTITITICERCPKF